MLTKPRAGWTRFSLEGTSAYSLSYLDDIAFDWLDSAIEGLNRMMPFCVKGYCEPHRVVCMVSYLNCFVIYEKECTEPLTENDFRTEYSHTSMLEFCEVLYNDISSDLDGWAGFVDYHGENHEVKKRELLSRLKVLKTLIEEKRKLFGEGYIFM